MGSLPPEQLVKSDHLSYLDLMNAIQIMDPRMDSYCAQKQKSEPAEGQALLPPFEPTMELLPEELLWMFDELLRVEMTWLDGHPLASTLFTCQYLRPQALAAMSSLRAGADASKTRAPGFRTVVLRGMLMGVIKCTEIVWEELCKGWLYEHEDVHLSLYSLDFTALLSSCFPPSPLQISSPDVTSPERVVTVDEVLVALDEAVVYVREFVEVPSFREALEQRLLLRIDLTYLFAFLTSPIHTSASALKPHITRSLEVVSQLAASPFFFTPSPSLLAAFSPLSSPPLPSPQPLREIVPESITHCWKELASLLNGVEGALDLWEKWEVRGEWRDVEVYWSFLGRREMLPYARSIHRTLLYSSPQLFARHPPLSLARSFLHTLIGLPISLFDTLKQVRDQEKTFNSPARKVLGWADRVAGRLVEVCEWRGGNRSRGRRRMVNSIPRLSQLADESPDLIKTFVAAVPYPLPSSASLIPLAISTLLLTTLLESILSGFELELYETEERPQVWWAAGQIAGAAAAVYERLLKKRDSDAGSGKFIESRSYELRTLEKMCLASMQAAFVSPPSPIKVIPPMLGSSKPPPFERFIFERRFQWVQGHLGDAGRAEDLVNWDLWQQKAEQLRRSPRKDLATSASTLFGGAIDTLTSFATIPMAERGATVKPEFQLRWIAALRRTAFANKTGLLDIAQDATEITWQPNGLRWDSPWFPTFCWNRAL